MKTNAVKISLVLISLLTSLSACSTTMKDCTGDCGAKSVPQSVQPSKDTALELKKDISKPMELAEKGPLVIVKVGDRATANEKNSSKASYQGAYCMQFEQAQDNVDVETMIEEMEASPFKNNSIEFWTTPACHAPLKNDTAVPILFNTASNTVKNEFFPKVLHDYLVEEKKDPMTWLKAINTTTSDGYTFLDFLQYNLKRGQYSVKESKDAALRIVTYLCKNGGVYSKYKNIEKCP